MIRPVHVEIAPEQRRQRWTVDRDRHVQSLGLRPEGRQPCVAQQRILPNRAPDLDADHVQPARRPVHFFDRTVHVLERHEPDAFEPLRTNLAVVVQPVVVRARSGGGEAGVEGDGERQLIGGIDDGHVDLVAIHVHEASPGIVRPHPAIVNRLAVRRRQVSIVCSFQLGTVSVATLARSPAQRHVGFVPRSIACTVCSRRRTRRDRIVSIRLISSGVSSSRRQK